MKTVLICLALMVPLAPAHAAAIMGTGYARGCFEAAESKRETREALRICDSALLDEALAVRERAATLVNRGIVNMNARNLDAALADYDAAIKVARNTAEAWVNKGIALLHKGGRDREVVAMLDRGLELGPLKPEVAYYTRAVANELLGKNREAYEDYSRAAQLAPGWSEPVQQLQRFQVVRGKTASG